VGKYNITYVNVPVACLQSDKTFRGFIISWAESYLLRVNACGEKVSIMTELEVESVVRNTQELNDRAVEKGYALNRGTFIVSIDEVANRRMTQDQKVIEGIITRKTISRFLKVSESSVKRWRKDS